MLAGSTQATKPSVQTDNKPDAAPTPAPALDQRNAGPQASSDRPMRRGSLLDILA
jgi:hypothetical protein